MKVIIVFFTPYFLSYYVIFYCTQFNETLWDHGGSNPKQKPWISNAKTVWWLMSSGKPRAVGNMHVFVACQIDVVNKQLVSPLSWNYPQSEVSLGKSYILTLYKHLDNKKKHYLDVDGAYNK